MDHVRLTTDKVIANLKNMPRPKIRRMRSPRVRRRAPGPRRPPLSEIKIIRWAKAHIRRTGQWPRVSERVPIPGVPGENWRALDIALRDGLRGLPGGSSLNRLLCGRGHLKVKRYWRPTLTLDRIWKWAQAHHKRHGAWPRLH